MSNCYFCGTKLNKTNSSIEHIIPNALGGKLKGRFLCKSCNSSFGSSHDAALAKSLEFFSLLVNPSRDRGEVQPVKMKMGDTDITIDAKSKIKPQIRVKRTGENQFSISGYGSDRDDIKKEFWKVLQNMHKDRPIPQERLHEYEQALKSGFRTIKPSPFRISLNLVSSYPGLLKVAINYAIYNSISSNYLAEPIEILKKDLPCDSRVRLFYPNNISVNELHPIHHHLILFGDAKLKALYCLISLYGCLDVFVLLSSNYAGNDIFHSYGYDLQTEKSYCIKNIAPLTKDVLAELISPSDFFLQQQNENQIKAIKSFLHLFMFIRTYDNIRQHLIFISQNMGRTSETTLIKDVFINRIKGDLKSYVTQHLKHDALLAEFMGILQDPNFTNILYSTYLMARALTRLTCHIHEYCIRENLIKKIRQGIDTNKFVNDLLSTFFSQFTTQDPEYTLICELEQKGEAAELIKNNFDQLQQLLSNNQNQHKVSSC